MWDEGKGWEERDLGSLVDQVILARFVMALGELCDSLDGFGKWEKGQEGWGCGGL